MSDTIRTDATLNVGSVKQALATGSRLELDAEQIETIVHATGGRRDSIQDIYLLSPLQEGMLFHHLLNQQADTYILSLLFEAQSQEKVACLVRAVQEVIDRHDVLRTAVMWEGLLRPVQVVHRQATLPLERIALDGNRAPMEQLMEEMQPGRRRIDLRVAPLVRLLVAPDPHDEKCYAVLLVHHLVCDHQSLNVIASEVIACAAGLKGSLPASVPFKDQLLWMVAAADGVTAEVFFRSKLGDVSESTAPFEVIDAHEVNSTIHEANAQLDAHLAQQIRIRASRSGVSVARLFHVAWGLVVAHTSGRDDVVYGTVLLVRPSRSAEAPRTVGLSINTLPLRLRLADASIGDLVGTTHSELSQLLQHAAVPLTLAQRCSGMTDAAPLFTSILNCRRSRSAQRVHAAGIRELARCEAWTNYPVTLTVDDLGEGFTLTAHTDRRIDPERVVSYMQVALQSLVQALDEAPQTPALLLPILPEAERRQVIEGFNATGQAYRREQFIHELFEEQARCTPELQAVVHDGKSLTYVQLDNKANQLARYLRSQGVAADQRVGICVERGVEMVVGLLGILKAGGTYVPLDPNYPAERLQYMVEDAKPKVVLTQEKLKGLLPATTAKAIALDTTLQELAHSDAEERCARCELSPHSLVYVIYTSGSTGRPKGIEMPHRAMVNLMEWHRRSLSLNAGQRVLQFAALSFDVAFQEIFSTLCGGGTLVLLDEWIRRDSRSLLELLCKQRIERLFLPPLMLQSLAECLKTGAVPQSLKDVITAGEQLRISPEIIRFFKQLPECRLHNHYGPTETHVVTSLTMTGAPEEWPALPSIGKPVANTQIYVLDRWRQPVPVGIAGEIYIGGDNVARGYLNQPGLTQERFVRNPFIADGRMYKTGDLGCWHADRTLEYMGRNDDQVKIRGFRIELGEIEAQLLLHERVREAAVIAREEVIGEKRLVAYVIPRGEKSPQPEELRVHLSAVLPEYMVPSAFVLLDGLPVTPSGKLNRRALPAPGLDAYVSRQYTAPQGEVEEALAGIWQKLLGIERIGRQDNFFRLGGHSLIGLRLVANIAETFGVQLHAAAVFRYRTLREMADLIEMLRAGGQNADPASIAQLDEGIIVPRHEVAGSPVP